MPTHRCQLPQNQDTTSTGRVLKSLKRITEVTHGKSGRQSTSGRTPIQRSTPHRGSNFPQSITPCWDLKIKHCFGNISRNTGSQLLTNMYPLPLMKRLVGLEMIWVIIFSVSAVEALTFYLSKSSAPTWECLVAKLYLEVEVLTFYLSKSSAPTWECLVAKLYLHKMWFR